jgi:hypothetical protein
MAGPGLSITVDTDNADSTTGDATVKRHQMDHDAVHKIVNKIDTTVAATAGFVPIGNGTALVTRSLVATDISGLSSTQTAQFVNVKDYGAVGNDVADDYTAVQNALNACPAYGTVLLPPATGYYVNGVISVPANRTVLSAAQVRIGSSSGIVLAANGATWQGGAIRYDTWNAAHVNALRIGRDDCTVRGVNFIGTARTAAIGVSYEEGDVTAGTTNGGRIEDCTFIGNGYAVLKNGALTTSNRFTISGNTLRNLSNGDAIEWNLGKGKGLIITGNTIDGVARGSTTNAGIAIGIAGTTDFGDPIPANVHTEFMVTNNTIRSAGEGIHVEYCTEFTIADNVCANMAGTTGELTGSAVVVFGSSKFVVRDNTAYDCTNGVLALSGLGYNSYNYSVLNNTVFNCDTGYMVQTQGVDMYGILHGNLANTCRVPYSLKGIATWVFTNNTSLLSTGASEFNFWNLGTGTPGYNNRFYCRGNSFIDDSGLTPNMTIHGLVSWDGGLDGEVVDEGNNFSLASGGVVALGRVFYGTAAPVAVERRVGDVTFNTAAGTPIGWVTTTAGSQKKTGTAYNFTCVAGNNYVTVTTGDASVAFNVGQVVQLPGAGVAGATLVTTIKRIYSVSSVYYVGTSTPVSTTVSTPALITPASTSVHKTIG